MKKLVDLRISIAVSLVLVAALFTLIYPDQLQVEKRGILLFLGTVVVIQLLSFSFFIKKKKFREKRVFADLSIFITLLFIMWEALTTKWNLLDSFVFPSPEKVLTSLSNDRSELFQHALSSTKLLITGYGLAFLCAVALGVFAGSNKRILELIRPIASAASPIPPIVYIPYAITLLPTFFMSSVFVVFIGAFWPILLNTMNGVIQIEKKLIDSAKTLQLSTIKFFYKILLPGALPGIFTGASIGLVFSFILLTAAELIGASSGLGYYVKYNSDFGDFSRVILGIILIGLYVTLLMNLLQRLENYFLRWRLHA